MELPRQQKIVFDYLSALVKNGRQQGELLPTVSSLTKTLSVSRMTVVKVLAIMESMDILYTKLGKGTFAGSRAVAEKKVMPYFHYVPVPPQFSHCWQITQNDRKPHCLLIQSQIA